jgi:hypothetical protein
MRSKRSPEEVAEWRAGLRAVSDKVAAMSDAERSALAEAAGTVTAEGRPLSVFNTVFLAHQTGRLCAQVGGYRQWQKAGRAVCAGEHACGYIFAPARKAEDPNLEPGETSSRGMRYVMVPVFDITQTEDLNDLTLEGAMTP